jgi:heme exporter protein D
VIAVAGLIWLGVTLFNMRQGGSFQWSGVGVFLIAIAALLIARGRSTRSR